MFFGANQASGQLFSIVHAPKCLVYDIYSLMHCCPRFFTLDGVSGIESVMIFASGFIHGRHSGE